MALLMKLSIMEVSFSTRLIGFISQNAANMPVFLWYSYHSYRAFKLLRNKQIEPWILTRMKMNSISAFVMAFVSIPDVFRLDPSVLYADPSNPISVFIFYSQGFIVMFFCVTQFLAWFMPSNLKRFFNRKYEFPKDFVKSNTLTEEDYIYLLKGEDQHK